MASLEKEKVNLDALIAREDFEASDDSVNSASKIATLSINDLKAGTGLFLASVRKPDFQRETADWSIEKVSKFVKSFVDGEFIPSVILWRSQAGLIFVIDGSHRFSSLIAWVNDDYGDGSYSLDMYEGDIPPEQKETAKRTRDEISKRAGQYKDYYAALTAKYPEQEILVKARNLASRALPIQWIDGDVETAERSFYNINQQAAQIDPTEMALIKGRKTPRCIAARAIMRGGKGHRYWHRFNEEKQENIETLAFSINSMLFSPNLERPLKTLDLPMCDKNNSLLSLVYDYVNFTNENNPSSLLDDPDGEATVDCLKKAEKIAKQFNSTDPCSYGLHPLIYCYSKKGNFRPSSFYGAVEFIKKMGNEPKVLSNFIASRKDFESFLFENDEITQKIIDTYRRGPASAKHISDYYVFVLDAYSNGNSEEEIREKILKDERFKKFVVPKATEDEVSSPDFNTNRKNEVFIRDAYKTAPRCVICGGLLHKKSITIDHIVRKQDGGIGSAENGQLAHPYCNTGVKN